MDFCRAPCTASGNDELQQCGQTPVHKSNDNGQKQHKHDNDGGLTNQFLLGGPGDLLDLGPHVLERLDDVELFLSFGLLRNCLLVRGLGDRFLFRHVVQTPLQEMILAGFLVDRVLLAEAAVLVHLQAIGVVALVLLGVVVALLALAAGQGDLHSHPLGTSLHSEIRLCAMGTETFL